MEGTGSVGQERERKEQEQEREQEQEQEREREPYLPQFVCAVHVSPPLWMDAASMVGRRRCSSAAFAASSPLTSVGECATTVTRAMTARASSPISV